MITLKSKDFTYTLDTKSLANMAVEAGVCTSRAEFKRLLDQGAVYLNNKCLNRDSLIWGDREFAYREFRATKEVPIISML